MGSQVLPCDPMVAHRDFDARPQSSAPPSGSFGLGGVTWKIRARSEVPFALVEQLLGGEGDDGSGFTFDAEAFAKMSDEAKAEQLARIRERSRKVLVQTDEFFAATIASDQVEDFLKVVHDPTGPYTVDIARELPAHISTCLFGGEEAGPTVPSRPSRSGRRATTSTSRAGSSSRATQKVRSAN